MRKTSFTLALVLLLVFTSYAYAPWWNSNWDKKAAIQLPAQDLQNGTTIEVHWTSIDAQADLDDVRIIDDNHNAELPRTCYGTPTDGNCSFRLHWHLDASDAGQDTTYYVYYDNAGATAPTDGNSADTNVCGWETFETCTYSTAGGSAETTQKQFGDRSYMLDEGEDLFFTGGLGARADDLNYTVWMYADVNDYRESFQLWDGADEVCNIWADTDGTWKIYDSGVYSTGVEYTVDTWYNIHIKRGTVGDDCNYTIYNAAGGVELTVSRNYAVSNGTIASVRYRSMSGGTGANSKSYWDNTYYGLPVSATGLGTEELYTATEGYDFNFWRADGYDPATQEFPLFTYVGDGNITMDFNVYNIDNNRLNLDINYGLSDSQGTGTAIITDLNLTSAVCSDQIWNDGPSSCSWDFNIFAVADGNYYLLFDLNGGGTGSVWPSFFEVSSKTLGISSPEITIRFTDENTHVPLLGLSVYASGTTYTTDQNGEVDIDLGGITGITDIYAWEDNNYGTRHFEFDINATATIDINASMVGDVNGIDINFEFYDTDAETVLTDTLIYAYNTDENFAGIRYTNSSGRTDFFLQPDMNYYFVAVKSGGGTVRYDPVLVTVQIPKDEDTLANITPFDVDISRLASRKFDNETAVVQTSIFSNTLRHYVFDFNATSDYYTRIYEVRVRGNPTTHSLQAYLTKIAHSGDFIFNVVDSTTLQPLSDIRIVVERTIPGEGTVEVDSITTDDTGKATISLLLGVEYETYFYYNEELVHSATIRPTAASLYYQVSLDISELVIVPVVLGWLDVNVSPTTTYMPVNSDGSADINLSITLTNKTVEWIQVRVLDTNNCLFDENTFGGTWNDANTIEYHVDLNNNGPSNLFNGLDCNFDTRFSLYVTIDVNSTDGNVFAATSIHWLLTQDFQWGLMYRLGLLADQINPPGSRLVTSFLAAFITILAVGSIAVAGVHNPVILTFLTCAIIALFVFPFGWIDLLPAAFIIFISFMFLAPEYLGEIYTRMIDSLSKVFSRMEHFEWLLRCKTPDEIIAFYSYLEAKNKIMKMLDIEDVRSVYL